MKALKLGKNTRSVTAEVDLPLSASEVWRRVSDVSNYPDFVAFVKRVSVEGEFREGSHWSDISTVLYFPLKFRHKIAKIEEGKNIFYLIDLPKGGKILQKLEVVPRGNLTRARLTIDVDLNSQLMDLLLGKLIERRTKSMIGGTFRKISTQAQREKGLLKAEDDKNQARAEVFIRKWYLAPAIVSFAAFIVLALVFGSNPSEIKAAPGKIISKVKSSETLVANGASKLKSGVNQVNDKLENFIAN